MINLAYQIQDLLSTDEITVTPIVFKQQILSCDLTHLQPHGPVVHLFLWFADPMARNVQYFGLSFVDGVLKVMDIGHFC